MPSFTSSASLSVLCDGAEGRNRTGDTMIFSHVLYQLSYLGTSRYFSLPPPA
jgi:hypothetical protein